MDEGLVRLSQNLAVSTGMVTITVLIHFWGLLGLTHLMGRAHPHLRPHEHRVGQAGMILLVVFGVFALHTVQIWLYAATYSLLGELRTFEDSLYFSTVTFVALGYGDVVLSPRWRLVSAIEAANGVILIAWSTAFLLTVTARLKLLDHSWPERED